MNELSDFGVNTQVLYKYPNGYYVPGIVVGLYCENIVVQWNDSEIGDLVDYHYSNPSITLATKIPEGSNIINKIPTEIKFEEFIIHLIGVNQTELACDVIGVLQKYKHNIQALDFIERNT